MALLLRAVDSRALITLMASTLASGKLVLQKSICHINLRYFLTFKYVSTFSAVVIFAMNLQITHKGVELLDLKLETRRLDSMTLWIQIAEVDTLSRSH